LPGIHLEGPFLSPEKKGAHNPEYLRLPNAGLMQLFLQAAAGMLRMVTLAPELPGAVDLIPGLVEKNVIVSGGHTAAHYDDFQSAVRAGMTFLTHIGNASDWPHRSLNQYGFLGSQPGMVGSLMAMPQLGGSIIMDGFHFHPALLKPLVDLKGSQKMALVSDASSVCGLPPGEYESGGLLATVHPEGFATSGRGGGWLAGSTITLLQAVQNAVHLAGLPLADALTLAALSPARLLGIADQKGRIIPGADADLLVLNRDLTLRHVIVKGQLLED
jgi:N-acetylglucosamine-6-phosphate deacetylase